MALAADVPAGSGGAASLRLTAGGSASATDIYKRLPDHDELFVRWYAKNYITEGPEGTVHYDDMVVATRRVGCLR